MKNISITILISFLTFSVNGQVAEKMDSLMQTYYAKGFNGNVLYSKEDTILFTGNYGYKEIETKTPLNDSTIFELASCSKQFTAVAIIQLIEKGLIGYQTTADEIIEGFPYQGITVEHLLRHQSGLPDYMALLNKRKVWKKNKIATNQNVINALKKFKPKVIFEPGTKYEYSNTGYVLLASIVEKISTMSYEDYLSKYIFRPAQMTHSIVYRRRYKPQEIENMSDGYSFNKRKKAYQKIDSFKKYQYVYWLDGIVGDGMVNSNLLDLEKWKQAIRYNKLISQESKEAMFTTDDISKNYGYGFVIEEKEKSGKLIYHFGGWAGYSTMTFYLPKYNEYIVVLCNNEYKDFFKILNGILPLRKYSNQ